MGHAIVYTTFGGPEVLTLVETEPLQATPGHVLVRVEAAGVNPVDAKLRSALRPSPPITEPRRVGSDGAGTVTAVGDDVDWFRPGDEVVFSGGTGAYASELLLPAHKVQHRPSRVPAAVGAALGIPAGTAYQTLRSLDVRSDDTLLLHGGSGSVGQAVIQFAVLWGATVVATASPERFDRIRQLGATPVEYGKGLGDRVGTAAPDGVTVAVDAAGTDEALDVSRAVVADRSRIATLVRGADAAGLGIRAFGGGSPDPLTPQQLAWRAEAIPVTLALLAADRFSVELGPELPLAEAAEAHRLVEAGTSGKITLVP
jgi:NADPH:quinone reductase-like Zn-dependent oxidoreductase